MSGDALRHVDDLRALDVFVPGTGSNGVVTAICTWFLAPSPDPWLSAAQWVRAIEECGFPSSTARSSLRRMTEAGYLRREPRDGSAGYAMSDALRRLLSDAVAPDPDDERWLLVTVRVPESHRDIRRQLRTLLTRGGFGSLGNGVWLGRPHQATRALEFAALLGMEDFLDVFFAEHIGPRDAADLIARGWDLPAIEAAWSELLAAVRAAPKRPAPPRAFALIVELFQRWIAVVEMSLGLAPSALPRNWPGARAQAALDSFRARHGAAAAEWLFTV